VQIIQLGAMEPEVMVPGLTRRFAVGVNTTVTLFEYEAGGEAPMHSHEHEQISYVIRGRLRATIGGKVYELGPGDAALVPPRVPHALVALTDALEIDFFTPARSDWMEGNNSYFDQARRRQARKS
jgi:quercetin dioxygenase-like cupin family protein